MCWNTWDKAWYLRYFFLCTIVKNKFNVWDILFFFKQPSGTFSFIASSCCRTYGFRVAFVFFLVVQFLLSWDARLRIEILNRETQGKCINCKARSLKCFLDKEKNNLWWVLKPSTKKKSRIWHYCKSSFRSMRTASFLGFFTSACCSRGRRSDLLKDPNKRNW